MAVLTIALAQLLKSTSAQPVYQSNPEPLAIQVDASDVTRGLFHITETMPAKPGKLTLWYPRWIPGEHGPTGPISKNFNFKIYADGSLLPWTRDPIDMFQVTVQVPSHAKQISIKFTHANASGSSHLARVVWNRFAWYPASPSDNLIVKASLKVPKDWKVACALPFKQNTNSNEFVFEQASLTRLVDSPAQIGQFYKQYNVTGKSKFKHYLEVMADTPEGTVAPENVLTALTKTHEEMESIAGAAHYKKYHWLLTVSDHGGDDGLEHHESSEDGTGTDAFTSPLFLGELLCHEYFHSFNGKYRRPKGLCTPDYQKPMQDELLWMYEGMTQFMGHVLACRAGWWTPEQWREQMAINYMEMNMTRGREWRPLVDTATGVPAASFSDRGGSWPSAQRGWDYYFEMSIIWLEVDMKIRELTAGKKSIFDFQRIFHGGQSNGPEVKPYTFNDIVNTLNQVVKYDWASLLKQRIYEIQPQLSTQGFEMAGWKVVYNDTPNSMMGKIYSFKEGAMLNTSLGMFVNSKGVVFDVATGYPADKAGFAPTMQILQVNGENYSDKRIQELTQKGGELVFKVNYKEDIRTLTIKYEGGLKIPHLERITGTADKLSALLNSK